MRIIGLDPGLRRTGWGVIESDGNRLIHVAHGRVVIDPDQSLAERLRDLFETLGQVIVEQAPEEAAVDDGIGAGAGPHRAHLGTFVHRDSSDLETHPSTSSHAVRLVNTLADFRATCAKP